jgi:hypothetical protein
LHVVRGVIHPAIQLKLNRDIATAQRAHRGHFCDAGNLSKPPFERCGEGGRNRGRVRPGQRRRDRDHREIHAWYRRDRHETIGDQTRKE